MLPPPGSRETANGYGADYRAGAGGLGAGGAAGAPPPGAAGDSYSSSYSSYYDRFYNKAAGATVPSSVGRPGEPTSLLTGQFGSEGGYGRGQPQKKPDTQTALQTGPIYF